MRIRISLMTMMLSALLNSRPVRVILNILGVRAHHQRGERRRALCFSAAAGVDCGAADNVSWPQYALPRARTAASFGLPVYYQVRVPDVYSVQ